MNFVEIYFVANWVFSCCNLEIQGRNYETMQALNMNILVFFYS